jgi:hypothetical protein
MAGNKTQSCRRCHLDYSSVRAGAAKYANGGFDYLTDRPSNAHGVHNAASAANQSGSKAFAAANNWHFDCLGGRTCGPNADLNRPSDIFRA